MACSCQGLLTTVHSQRARNRLIAVVAVVVIFCLSGKVAGSLPDSSSDDNDDDDMSRGKIECVREAVFGMFRNALDDYMAYAFPHDELLPLSCRPKDGLMGGGVALTLIDALDTLALFGKPEEFAKAVRWVAQNVNFDIDNEQASKRTRKKRKGKKLLAIDCYHSFSGDINVSVFETNIRVLGGLLSAHLLADDIETGISLHDYNGELLNLAWDLGKRLMPAFSTATGIPYGTVNLRYGVPRGETPVTSTASATTYLMEFGLLSRLTGDTQFERSARRAVTALWNARSRLNLVGGHIDVQKNVWTHKDAGIGTSIDSFYEYLFKSYLLFGDKSLLQIFYPAYEAALKYLKRGPWYIEASMDNGALVWPIFNSLQAFWPGLQTLIGDIAKGAGTFDAFFSVWRKYGFIPEGFNIVNDSPHLDHESYPLRPELAESAYYLYKATRDPYYLKAASEIALSLLSTRAKCGHASVASVKKFKLTDHMETFFLSETTKYLLLTFDLALNNSNIVNSHETRKPYEYIFSTEGHLFPLISTNGSMVDEFGLHQRKKCEEIKDKCILDEKDGQSLVKYLIPGGANSSSRSILALENENVFRKRPVGCAYIFGKCVMSDFIHPFLDTMTLKPNQSPEMAAFSIAQEVGYGSILYQDQKPMGGVQLADAPGIQVNDGQIYVIAKMDDNSIQQIPVGELVMKLFGENQCKPEKEICLDDPAAATECIPKPFTIEDIIAPTCQDSQIKPKEEMEIKQLDLQSLALMRQLFGVAGKTINTP